MVIYSYGFAMLFYIEHVHLQSISVILHFFTVLKKTGKKTVKNTGKTL
jgi:hypothetical protein